VATGVRLGGGLADQHAGSPANAANRTGPSKKRRFQEALAAHLRLYPARWFWRLVLILDNAPRHRGASVQQTLADNPHLEFYLLPSYSPQRNVSERF
jgi:hypothetical protein